jgi:hypothetical protein
MKIRNGFVSNSSTASFIVRHTDQIHDKKPLSEKEIKLLEEFGFHKTYAYYPHQEENNTEEINKNNDQYYNYGYYTTCNEDIPLEFLLNNNISFVADCHYDQYTLVYNQDQDYVTVCINAGYQYLMHGKYADITMKDKKCIEQISKKDIIEKGYMI